ncbi:MAG: alpha-glucan family phosphorylase [Actinomycetota bacterium]
MTDDGARDLARAARDLADRLPERLWPLARVAYNYRWSWTPGGEELLRGLDPFRYERCRGNPVRLLHQLPAATLEAAESDDEVVARAAELEHVIDEELAAPSLTRGEVTPEHPVAFVCAEFGVHRSLPIYQGGLGVLAGDILKGASDLRLPMVGVGILYSKGSFHQRLDPTGWQHDYWTDTEPDRLPLALVTADDGTPVVVEVPVRSRSVRVQVWRVQVGRVPLFLLDANREDNGTAERWITSRLYVGDRTVRLEQYALLGVGGMRVLRALGIEPSVVHVNEGHGAFAPLELAARERSAGATPTEALDRARSRTVFTTHTPVAAGNESHDAATVLDVLGGLLSPKQLRELGTTDGDGSVGMTTLGLRLSRKATAVSRLHGEVARRMWRPLFSVASDDDVPIDHVTNGVHVPTWMAPRMHKLLDRHLGDGWLRRGADPTTWAPVDDIPEDDLWQTREQLRGDLVAFVREADAAARLGRYEDASAVEAVAHAFEPDRLTLGFARRVATYKRLRLLYQDPGRLESLLGKPDTVQFVIAGKAHPRDTEAKEALAELIRHPLAPDVAPRIAFLEDYDLHVAAHLVAGCDVWVNLPRPPMEASGTSGMKAALNGGLNLSVPDGWWAEAYDGANGWGVGDGTTWEDPEAQDDHDAAVLFDLIERELLPMFHDRDGRGVPRDWVAKVKHSLRVLGPRFGADRMLREYLERVYAPE